MSKFIEIEENIILKSYICFIGKIDETSSGANVFQILFGAKEDPYFLHFYTKEDAEAERNRIIRELEGGFIRDDVERMLEYVITRINNATDKDGENVRATYSELVSPAMIEWFNVYKKEIKELEND